MSSDKQDPEITTERMAFAGMPPKINLHFQRIRASAAAEKRPKNSSMRMTGKIAVVIPSYRVCNHILDVIDRIGPEVSKIYVVDDCCPDYSGDFVEANCDDKRVTVIRQPENRGVGGAVMTGYQAAIEDGMEIIVKIDGDGQ